MGDTLLSYAVSSNPDPIQVSPQTDDPSPATLMIVVSNDTHQLIDCQSISFSFLKGTNAKDFFSDDTGIGTSHSDGWSINQSGALFTATPDTAADGQVGADGLSFVISNIKVNEQPGTTDMTITEVTTSNTGTLDIPLAKFPANFTVGDLNASSLSVAQGGSTTLSWSGSSGATYTLQYGDTVVNETKDGQPLPATGSYEVDDLQDDPTIFYLVVTYQPPGGDAPLVTQRDCPVTVLVESVALAHFKATPAVIYGTNNNVPVTLSWEATAAHQLVLDNSIGIVTGSSYTVMVNEPTQFLLTATGYQGPVYSECNVTVEDVNMILAVNGNSFALSFMANSGNYQIYLQIAISTSSGTTYSSTTETVGLGGPAQVVMEGTASDITLQLNSADAPVNPSPPVGMAGGPIASLSVTVSGFASGSLTRQFPS
ncbi:MAG TPA: hypothetical protein VGC66_01430 [Pyrinomonadaceae bacterium]